METATFRTEGIACACKGSIGQLQAVQKQVKKLNGVQDFVLNAISNQLTVSFDPSAVSIADIQQSVAKVGVKAVLLDRGSADAHGGPALADAD